MGEAAAAIGPEVAMFGGEAAASGISLGAEAGGILGTGIGFGDIATGASIASLGLSAAGSFMGGEATAAEKQSQAQNYLYAGAAKALNYRVEGETRAANYEYAGTTEQTQREMEASGLEVQGSRAQRAADFGKLQASLTDATMRENLGRTLGGIQTTLAARHIDPTSPTGAAFTEHQRIIGERQRQAQLLTINSQVAEDESSSAYYKAAAKFALSQGERAKSFADYNASVARYMGTTNAAIAEKSAALSAGAATASGDAAIAGGDIAGISKILAGIGKAAA